MKLAPQDLKILYDDNHLLAIAKPAGLATMGVAEGEPSLLALAKQWVKERYEKPGNVYLGAMSRLDVPVSGVVLFARTSKAAARLTEQFRSHTVRKTYWAIVEGTIKPDEAECVDWLVEDERHRRVRIAAASQPGAKEARLAYRRLAAAGGKSLIEIDLHTGRKHQIRVQLAHRGFPVLGDRKYGSRHLFPDGIALHARRLTVSHPTQGFPITLDAEVPKAWRSFGLVP
ncbi:MAG: RluA family pseudouridine synthase [Pirellulales bacterium]